MFKSVLKFALRGDTRSSLARKFHQNISLHTQNKSNINDIISKNIDIKTVSLNSMAFLENDDDQTPEDIIRQGNMLPTTRANKQLNTMEIYNALIDTNMFNTLQARTILKLLEESLDEQFYSTYNYKFVKKMEIDNFSYLYDNLSNNLKFELKQLSNIHLLKRFLQNLKTSEDLGNQREELDQLLITELQKGSKVDFINHKIENTLLYKDINSRLKQLDYKINTHLLGQLQSHTEELRWYTMKNGLLLLLIIVSMVMVAVNINKFTAEQVKEPTSVILKTLKDEEDHDHDDDNRDGGDY